MSTRSTPNLMDENAVEHYQDHLVRWWREGVIVDKQVILYA
jgi:hypothetical protein